jgi:hypothetical protein
MATIEEIKPGRIFRHKGGKLYKIDAGYGEEKDAPRWSFDWDAIDPSTLRRGRHDKSKVWATQWQVNEKYPQGREYQAARELKIADLTAIDA